MVHISSQIHTSATMNTEHQSMAGSAPVVAVRDLGKTYWLGQTEVHALRGVTLNVYPGEFVAVMGPSGSGKSTFMNVIGCLDRPTSGEYWLSGVPVSRMSPDRLADVRNRRIGFIFQGFHLLPRETALANVMLPMMYAGVPGRVQEQRAQQALKLVGLGDRLHHLPMQLSGGQQQRVAIARSLVNQPSLLLADEPTGNLDTRTSHEIMDLLQMLNQQGLTIILVTHEEDIAAFAGRQIHFRDGQLITDEKTTPRIAQQVEFYKALEELKTPENPASTRPEPAHLKSAQDLQAQEEDLDEYE